MFHVHALWHLLAGVALWATILFILKTNWRTKQSLFIFASVLAANLIDIDHLLATPVYDPLRCSIGFHPLHSIWAMPVYLLALGWERTRYVALGVFAHLIIDWLNCL